MGDPADGVRGRLAVGVTQLDIAGAARSEEEGPEDDPLASVDLLVEGLRRQTTRMVDCACIAA